MKKDNKLKKQRIIIAIVFIIIIGYVGVYLKVVPCIIKYFTGVSCLGWWNDQGMLAALKLDFSMAFYYHPLFFMLMVILIIILNRKD